MILDRLSVRGRVNLLALIPLLVAVLLEVPVLTASVHSARSASRLARTAELTRQVGLLVEQIQLARLSSLAYLSGRTARPEELVGQLQDVEDRRADLLDQVNPGERPALVTALDQVHLLGGISGSLSGRWPDGESADRAFTTLIRPLIDGLDLAHVPGDPARVGALQSLDALLRADEQADCRAGELLLAAIDPDRRSLALADAHDDQVLQQAATDWFRRLATPDTDRFFTLADTSKAASRLTAAETQLRRAGTARVGAPLVAEVYAAARSQTVLRQVVELQVVRGVAANAEGDLRTARFVSVGLGGGALVFLIAVLLLSVTVGRSVSAPLRRLTDAAGTVADLAHEELRRVADEDGESSTTPRLTAIRVRSRDEIGDLAEAFNRVQATAAALLERQALIRRNVAAMFASVGRRTSNLVGRQLALIDALERAEERPDTLATLYRLDHTATRLRRSASSLVVLSGGSESLGELRPVPVCDLVRAAVATVEDYHRITLHRLPRRHVVPAVVSDLALLLAELLENALTFSPPSTTVDVIGRATHDGGCRVTIVDRGMGVPPQRLAEENSRLRRRERLDLAPSEVLGLFVVGRIARRHGIMVHLAPTEPSGLTAVVTFPPSLLVAGAPASAPVAEPAPTPAIERARTTPGTPPRPGTRGPTDGRGAPATAAGLRRRVRGTHWAGTPVPSAAHPPPTVPACPGVTARPEPPEAVLAWAEDLEAAFTRQVAPDDVPTERPGCGRDARQVERQGERG